MRDYKWECEPLIKLISASQPVNRNILEFTLCPETSSLEQEAEGLKIGLSRTSNHPDFHFRTFQKPYLTLRELCIVIVFR